MPLLGVNIDHVATVRQARRTYEPDPVWAAAFAELGGADGITIHLREDRRHIQERDLRLLKETTSVTLNLELACVPSIIDLACEVRPQQATLVPEKREEVTTEGGLDLFHQPREIRESVEKLQQAGILVSLFLDADPRQLDAAKELQVEAVELHTGQYALAQGKQRQAELEKLARAGQQIHQLGMLLHAGHGLNYQNVCPVAQLPHMRELNIGHAIISRALFVGMQAAVKEMKALL